ncbi:ATP-dependent DNA helicase chl1 [Lecanora helva]
MESNYRDFHHPYEPYDIQIELMNAIYDCVAQGKVGIFESPTGTGKSLSLICSSLTWLRDAQDESLQDQLTVEVEKDEPSWVVEAARAEKKNLVIEQRVELERRLQRIRAKEREQKHHYESGQPNVKRKRVDEIGFSVGNDGEARFELDEYNSADEDKRTKVSPNRTAQTGVSSASLQLMKRLGLMPPLSSEDHESEPTDELKIYFCSRTHSQLTQFVHEVRRVRIRPPSWAEKPESSIEDRQIQNVKHVPLGSRKNLCINSKVSKLGSAPAISERCLDLQQPNTPKVQKCSFLPNQENETLVNDFRDHTMAKVRDIEDLNSIGRNLGICPYYASRATIKPSEIVTLPYPLLLQKSAREALGISLKGHIVVIDEAHNLMDTISNLHSVSVTLTQLKLCRSQIGFYLQKFRNKVKGKNRVYIAQTVRLIDSLSTFLDNTACHGRSREGIVSVAALMAGKGVDQINLYKLMHYLQESKLARKVEGYTTHIDEQEQKLGEGGKQKPRDSSMPVLTHVQCFLETLTNPAAEGRFFYERDDGNSMTLKYMLLDPTHHFKEIVEDARAVILAGGTMSPMDDYVHHLFAHVNSDRLKTFSCGHIIPKENLIALPVARGSLGNDFDFTYEKRDSSSMIDMLGNYLIKLSCVIPDGLVVFFPSYAYLDQVVARWQIASKSLSKNIWTNLQSQKPIFRESKMKNVGDLLNEYSEAISYGRGGLLFSVIGGKLSEGINFSDAMGRGVVVVGLPFPNIQSAQWKAKLEYIEESTTKRSGKKDEGKAAAKEFYENSCMRAVNQSIGRAIRHRNDYASIILLDKRYTTQRIEMKLPGWIRQGIESSRTNRSLEDMMESLRSFFESKKDS